MSPDFWFGALVGFVSGAFSLVFVLYVAARIIMIRDAEMFLHEQSNPPTFKVPR
mgnify:CR=1 FL=1